MYPVLNIYIFFKHVQYTYEKSGLEIYRLKLICIFVEHIFGAYFNIRKQLFSKYPGICTYSFVPPLTN